MDFDFLLYYGVFLVVLVIDDVIRHSNGRRK